jgi:hypothetical protein
VERANRRTDMSINLKKLEDKKEAVHGIDLNLDKGLMENEASDS